jgi:YHS domain-containing protein
MTKPSSNILALALLVAAAPLLAGGPVNVAGASQIAVSGYDPVAFFTDGKALTGSPSITAVHDGATYLFASEEHKKLFLKDAVRYLPQYGGFCAFGAAKGGLFPVDISTWQVRDGKLYLNFSKDVLARFNAAFDEQVTKADKNWPGLVQRYSK